MTTDIRLGRWQDVLADVEVDALICDPPYLSACADVEGGRPWATTDRKQRPHQKPPTPRQSGPVMNYQPATADSLVALCQWSKRVRGWCVFFNDFDGAALIRSTLLAMNAVVAEPIAWVKPAALTPTRGSCILPQKGTEFIVVARHVSMKEWGRHLPGHYAGPASTRPQDIGFTGGKPLALMRALVRDYSRPGDLVCDPFCGSGTTALACMTEGRRFVGSEVDPKHHAISVARCARGATRDMFSAG